MAEKGILMNEATLQKEQLDLLGMVVPHFGVVGSEEAKHYLRTENRNQIPHALKRGFVLPGAIPLQAVPVEVSGYPIEETDCFQWLNHMEQFAEQRFGMKVDLRDMFPLPVRLPWKAILPIFDPEGFTNRSMVDKALKSQGLRVWEGTNVDEFSGATADASRLYLIHRSPTPTPATMGLPPKFAKHWFAGRPTRPLHLRGYGIGTGLLYQIEKTFLDPKADTVSWFVENIYGPAGAVADGCYYPDSREVGFGRRAVGDEDGRCGFREAIVLSLKPQS